MPKKKSATKRSVPIDKLSMVETLQMKIIELEQELRIQKASMASMNVVPNNIGQNSVETMSAFAENLWGISPMPMLNNTNECHGPGNKFSTAAFAQTPMLNNNNINVPIRALAGTQSASTSPFEGQGNAHSAMPGFVGGTWGLGSQITPITNMLGTHSHHDATTDVQYKLFLDKLQSSESTKIHSKL